MNMGESMKFVKVIYFDESSVADYMQIILGGEFKKTTEFITSINSDMNASADVDAGIGTNGKNAPKLFSFLSGITFNASANGSADINRKKEKIAKNILENTLLADFLDLIDKDERKIVKNRMCTSIKSFKKIIMYPEPNSFSFLMLAAPFFTMLDGNVPIPSNDGSGFKMDISKIEEAIARGRGYYEFVSTPNEIETIFRFNNSAFRNNYTMSDLPKMQLSLYAIYVGKTDKRKLDLSREFEFGTKIKNRVNYIEDIQAEDVVEIDVYDVILAGISE
jgi:hypothetical protein